MTPLCLAPLVLLGYAWTIQTSWHHSADVDAFYAQAQTCKTGFGLHGKVSAAPWVSGGLHYGWTWEPKPEVELTVQPQLGLSYFNVEGPNGHRQIGRFEVGMALMASFRRVHVVLEYQHMSNGEGTHPGNVGLDLVGLSTGWRF